MKNITSIYISLMIVLSMVISIHAVNYKVEGYIIDAQTNEPLFGANIFLVGTSLGSSTDMDGKYEIRNVPAGSYTLKVSYIGYESQEINIQVQDKSTKRYDFKISPEEIIGETVVITAQAEGQMQAINQQLTSDRIINVVSAARIQELPDANAAESVGRLPGVSVLRSGGEGDKVVIRGLDPKFNGITVNGVRMSTSNANDRSTDLSIISSNMLDGIDVTKTVTPDLDANVIGGVVNFQLREARVKTPGVPQFSFVAQGSYNGLSNARNKYNNYKFVGTVENRFFNDLLGLFVQGTIERRNLSSNELAALYGPDGFNFSSYTTNTVTIDDISRDRKRGNGVLAIDYTLPEGKIIFSNLFGTSNTLIVDRQQNYNIVGDNITYGINHQKSTLNSITNMIRWDQKFSSLHVYTNLAHSYSETKNPADWTVLFIANNAGLGRFSGRGNVDPRNLVRAAVNDTNNTQMSTLTTNNSFIRERALTTSVDVDFPVNITDGISAIVKFGGKYQYLKRSTDLNTYGGEPIGYSSGSAVRDQLRQAFPWFKFNSNQVSVSPFLDRNYDYGEFLGGDYEMVNPLDVSRLNAVMEYVYNNQIPLNPTYNYNIGGSITNDYWGDEYTSAAYIMATFKIGQYLTVIPGVRFQQLKTTYKGVQGLQGPNSFDVYKHTIETYQATHPYWLPDVLVRYKPLDWFDVRLAFTNSISYPDYVSLSPRININPNAGTLQWNGFKLDPVRSKNFDAYLSFYENKLGLFTVGGFLKKMTDVIYAKTFTPRTVEDLINYYPEWVEPKPTSRNLGIRVTTFINNPYEIDNYGAELDWQTNFWYLPKPFSGVILGVNYTHIFSKAQYPFEFITNTIPKKYIDSVIYAPLIYQPDDIVNLTLGYDYKGFSLRVSSIYSARIFTHPDNYPNLHAYTTSYNRWDISMKQNLPVIKDFEVFINVNNINGVDDESVISVPASVPQRKQSYKYMIEAGIRGDL